MSQLVSPPPVSPGLAYAVRKLLEYAPESKSEARKLCSRRWPKMDSDAIQTVVTYWHAQVEHERPLIPSAVLSKIGEGSVRGKNLGDTLRSERPKV